jgi:2-C-methyl-D-erythritol 4-phosphate cytidylyltransferase
LNTVAAVITAAGASRRWADSEKKEYFHLEDRPVLAWAIKPFFEISDSVDIVVTLPTADVAAVKKLLQPFFPSHDILFAPGGNTRQDSVRLGLEALEERRPQHVLIHDGARPWVSRKLVQRVLEGSRRWGACIPVMEGSEAPKRVGPSGQILEDLSKKQVRFAQTPQGFDYQKILSAHRKAQDSSRVFLDDAEVYAAFWTPVYTVSGERSNRKITFREDVDMP